MTVTMVELTQPRKLRPSLEQRLLLRISSPNPNGEKKIELYKKTKKGEKIKLIAPKLYSENKEKQCK